MKKNEKHAAAIPNPLLEPFGILIGEWETEGSHPYLPGITLHGHASFNWLEGGAFISLHTQMDDPRIPAGIALFGGDDAPSGIFYALF